MSEITEIMCYMRPHILAILASDRRSVTNTKTVTRGKQYWEWPTDYDGGRLGSNILSNRRLSNRSRHQFSALLSCRLLVVIDMHCAMCIGS